jgi:hypothetical protein
MFPTNSFVVGAGSGPSSKLLATCGGTLCGSRTSRSSPQRSSHQSLPPQREGLWIRCGCAADGNCGPEVACCGTSARCNSPSPDLTDSDIRYVPPEAPGDRDAGRCPRSAYSPMLPDFAAAPGAGWGGVVLVVLVISARGTGPDGPNSRSTRSPNICCPASVPVLSAMGPIHV